MKTLYIVRHAKSSRDNESLPDIDRPLNERGYEDAVIVSKNFLTRAACPDQIVSSPACRAISTALIFARIFQYSYERIQLNGRLYDTNVRDHIHVIGQTNDSISSLMIFSHNFTASELVSSLLGKTFEEMPTCALVCLNLEINSWKEVMNSKGVNHFYIYPRMLKPS